MKLIRADRTKFVKHCYDHVNDQLSFFCVISVNSVLSLNLHAIVMAGFCTQIKHQLEEDYE